MDSGIVFLVKVIANSPKFIIFNFHNYKNMKVEGQGRFDIDEWWWGVSLCRRMVGLEITDRLPQAFVKVAGWLESRGPDPVDGCQ